MIKYFSYETDPMLACPCCGDRGMVTDFLKKLDLVREDYGKPIIISSGFRCSSYNAKISSTGKDGPHTTGRAVDIPCFGDDAFNLLDVLMSHGITGIGINQKGVHNKRFIHADDIKSELRPWIWSY